MVGWMVVYLVVIFRVVRGWSALVYLSSFFWFILFRMFFRSTRVRLSFLLYIKRKISFISSFKIFFVNFTRLKG